MRRRCTTCCSPTPESATSRRAVSGSNEESPLTETCRASVEMAVLAERHAGAGGRSRPTHRAAGSGHSDPATGADPPIRAHLSTAVEDWTDAALEKWTPLTIGE